MGSIDYTYEPKFANKEPNSKDKDLVKLDNIIEALFSGILTNSWLVYKKNWSTIGIRICYQQSILIRQGLAITLIITVTHLLRDNICYWAEQQYLNNNSMTKVAQLLDNNQMGK